MATYRKRKGKKGISYTASVRIKGFPEYTETFPTKAQAEAWAGDKEAEIRAGRLGEIPPTKTFGDLLIRYRDEVVIKKRGAKWENNRINAWIRDEPMAKILLKDLTAMDADRWIKRREKEVAIGSVLRELTILSHACTMAVRPAWRWLHHNPFKEIERPKMPAPRTRRPSAEETETLLYTLSCNPLVTPETYSAKVGFAYLFAIETAMRAGEIVGLTPESIRGRVAHLALTKNGSARDVPLSPEALRLLSLLPPVGKGEPLFGLTSRQLDALFRKATAKAMVEDLHFHDTRREALTRMAANPKLDVMLLAKISGHKDLRILQNTYYAPKMENVAGLLD